MFGHGVGGVSTHPPRGPHLLREEAAGNDELARAVDQALVVLEVARESHVSEDRLLELAIQRVKHAVDAYARLLLLDAASFGLQPEDGPLVSLHVGQKLRDSTVIPGRRRLDLELDTRLHDIESRNVNDLHFRTRRQVLCSNTLFFFSVFSSIEYKRHLC